MASVIVRRAGTKGRAYAAHTRNLRRPRFKEWQDRGPLPHEYIYGERSSDVSTKSKGGRITDSHNEVCGEWESSNGITRWCMEGPVGKPPAKSTWLVRNHGSVHRRILIG